MTPATDRCFRHFTPGDPTECWPWRGAIRKRTGYGLTYDGGKNILAHRVVYAATVGPLPDDGRGLDHICHNRDESCPGGRACLHRRCVNPLHLEPATSAVNTKRGAARRKTCNHGHPLDGIKSDGTRYCKTCGAGRQSEVRAERRTGVRPEPRTIVCGSCGLSKPLCAKGLCRTCYTRHYRVVKGAAARPGRLRAKLARANSGGR